MRSERRTIPVSNRRYGWQFGLGLTVISMVLFWQGFPFWLVASLLSVALLHFVAAWVAPSTLAPLNRGWMGLGILLGRVLSPLVLALMFALLFVPTGAVMRLLGRDELLLRDRRGDSFWRNRAEPTISSGSFRNQY